jgi:hypothetical protein
VFAGTVKEGAAVNGSRLGSLDLLVDPAFFGEFGGEWLHKFWRTRSALAGALGYCFDAGGRDRKPAWVFPGPGQNCRPLAEIADRIFTGA